MACARLDILRTKLSAFSARRLTKNGEHRRNVVTKGVSLKALRRGKRFRVGEVFFEYLGARSVCRYIERLTEPGMTQALKGHGGICARVIETGKIWVADEIEVL